MPACRGTLQTTLGFLAPGSRASRRLRSPADSHAGDTVADRAVQHRRAEEAGQQQYDRRAGRDEQAGADRPTGIKPVYQKLVRDRGQHEAEHAMMDCLGEELWRAQREQREPDEAAYLECLKKL